MKQIQYVLVNKETGEPATQIHQDDMETPIVGICLTSLFAEIEDWNDTSGEAFDVAFQPGGSLESYKIVRQEIETFDLNPEEQAMVQHIISG